MLRPSLVWLFTCWCVVNERAVVSDRQLSDQRISTPSTTGLRGTFDRLPYGCLLFMYRLDLGQLDLTLDSNSYQW